MARIRTIKPEFPQSETMGRVSRDARLLFIQLWTVADDSGRTRGHSRVLASLLYPYDDDARDLLPGWLDELEDVGAIRRYIVGGDTYLEICNWLKHQKIDKPSGPKCPGFAEGSPRIREPSSGDRDRDHDPDHYQDHEGKGPTSAIPKTESPARKKVSRETPPQEFLDFKRAYPHRAGDPRWKAALKAGRARIAEGHTWEEMTKGARRYTVFLRATGKLGTEFVKTAAAFLGPEKPFLLSWDLPAKPGNPREPVRDPDTELMQTAKSLGYGPQAGETTEQFLARFKPWNDARIAKLTGVAA